ncbi:MAG: hemolysin family protein [Candidatus Cloacimonetes bacterium]|nr:hemolysin family protein [Candidatus Cloacimonadota bacterium]MDD4559848.1 hemolysin family protein [Candidatus Cloacimonadota bacterium]
MPEIIYIVVLLALSAFFSASETTLFSLNVIYLKKLENKGGRRELLVLKLLSKPRKLLVTILLGNTFVNIAISSFSTIIAYEIATSRAWDLSLVITLQIIIVTIVILFFGEIVPKLIALSKANELCLVFAYPVAAIQFIISPVVWIFVKLSDIVSSKHGEKNPGKRFTEEDFHNLIQSDSSSASLEEHERRMLVGLFRFREAEISEIYVPRVKIVAIEENDSLDHLRQLIVESGYSRIPVYKETIDDIVGIIYVKDLILYPEKTSIVKLMRPAWFITENMKVQTLLNQFKQKKLQVAVVVDEYGGTSGIISLEDILEEIVGEIQDEYDADEIPEFSECEDGNFLVSGNYSVRQFNQKFSRDISVDEYDNMAEFLLAEFNHVPQVGEIYNLDESMKLEIMDSDEKSIKQIKVKFCEDDE